MKEEAVRELAKISRQIYILVADHISPELARKWLAALRRVEDTQNA